MLTDDTWAKPGWTGVITSKSIDGSNVRVNWDNGKSFIHMRKHMVVIDPADDPNVAFQIRKLKKKGFRI